MLQEGDAPEEKDDEIAQAMYIIDPAFDYISANAFRNSRTGRTVWVPGIYGRSGIMRMQ